MHTFLEGFWNNDRKGGNLFGEMPTIGEYNRALYNSLENAVCLIQICIQYLRL
jgi:hypothetical protein